MPSRSACLLWMMAGVLATSVALGRDYYVSPTGSDANPGTLDLPFQTIQFIASGTTLLNEVR